MGNNANIQKTSAQRAASNARKVESSKTAGSINQTIKTAKAASTERQHKIKIKDK